MIDRLSLPHAGVDGANLIRAARTTLGHEQFPDQTRHCDSECAGTACAAGGDVCAAGADSSSAKIEIVRDDSPRRSDKASWIC